MRRKQEKTSSKKSRTFKYILAILIFILVIGLILFTTLYKGKITGESIKNLDFNESFKMTSETNIPSLKISGEYDEISVNTLPNQELIIGDKKISFEKESNSLVLKGFSGKIIFDENYISFVQVKVSEAYINGISIKSEGDKKMKIAHTENLKYTSLKIKEISLKEINFVCSGTINIEKENYKLDNEKLIIKNLSGEIMVSENRFVMNGLIKNLEIKSDKRHIKYAL